jgi:hypothetical protein
LRCGYYHLIVITDFCTHSNRIKFCSCAVTKPMLESHPMLPEDIWSFYLCPQQGTKDKRRNPFWCRVGYAQATFPYQDPYRFPFGYPDVGTLNSKGEQIVAYLIEVTRLLQLPLHKHTKASKQEKKERTAMKKRMSAQLNLF